MTVTHDIEKIRKILQDLSSITGLSFAFYKNSNPTVCLCAVDKEDDEFCHRMQRTDRGKEMCLCSDAELLERAKAENRPVSHICHAGLVDTAVPMIKNGITLGFIIIGRVRTSESLGDIGDRLSWLGDPRSEIERRYKRLSYFSEARLNSLISLVSSMLLDGAVRVDYDSFESAAEDYIKANLSEELSVEILCKKFFVSKNQLYRAFRQYFGCTVNEYVNKKRIERAKELLSSSTESSRRIADSVGITNYTYFSKLFKKQVGLTPHRYRKATRR